MLCRLSASDIPLLPGQETIITWEKGEKNAHHTKQEYIKIFEDARYEVSYAIKWNPIAPTTQPFQVSIHRIGKEFSMHTLQQNVTVCTKNPVTLKKKFAFDLLAGERICISAKNFSTVEFILTHCQLSLTQI